MIEAAAGGVFAAVGEPEYPRGRPLDAVDDGGRLGGVDGDDGPGVLSADERAAGVSRTEAALEVHGGAEAVWFPIGEGAQEGAFEELEVAGAGGVAGGLGAAIFVGDEFEGAWTGLAKAVGAEAQDARTGSSGADAADDVSVFAPELESALLVGRREGVFRGEHVEEDFAVFEDEGFGIFGEEGSEGGGDFFGGLFRGNNSGRGHVVEKSSKKRGGQR